MQSKTFKKRLKIEEKITYNKSQSLTKYKSNIFLIYIFYNCLTYLILRSF